MGPNPSDWCPYKKRKFGHKERHQGCTRKRPYEDTETRQPSASQGRSPLLTKKYSQPKIESYVLFGGNF